MTAPQRSPAWHQARKGRVTGSIAGAVLGLSPNMKREQAMRLLVRDALGAPRETTEFVEKNILAHGRHYEEGALWEYEMTTDNTVVECGFFPYEDWSGASPDGLIGDDGIVEIKTPWGKRKDAVPVFKTLNEQPHYYAQIQIELLSTGRQWCDFYQWTPVDNKLERVQRDQDWLDRHLPILRQFHAELLWEVENNPEEHLAPLRVTIDTPAAATMVREYDELSEAIERATERRKDLLAEMVSLAGERNALFGGRKLTKVEKAGAVSYSKALSKYAPDADLEPFRGKAASYWGLK